MPHFTPSKPDTVVFATVKVAMSSSVNDVADYLHDLKTDLHIGQDGYPTNVILCGDQQTYALVKNLKRKYPDSYSWIHTLCGDWHLIKCAGETIKRYFMGWEIFPNCKGM